MGLQRIRVDSVKELQRRKTPAQLAKENEDLRGQVAMLESRLTDTQMALCDVYELATATIGGTENG